MRVPRCTRQPRKATNRWFSYSWRAERILAEQKPTREIQRCTLQRATGSQRWGFGAEPGWLFKVVSFIMLVSPRVSKCSGKVNFLDTKISFDSVCRGTKILDAREKKKRLILKILQPTSFSSWPLGHSPLLPAAASRRPRLPQT